MSAESAVPPGRVDLVCNDRIIEMYTLQHADVATALERDGVVHPDLAGSSMADDEQFVTAYRWLAKQLVALAEVPAGFDPDAGAMFWGYARITRRDLCSQVEQQDGGEPSVLLRVRLARNRVVLTDLSDWSTALSGLVLYQQAEMDAQDAVWDSGGGYYLNELEREFEATYGRGWRNALTAADIERVHATWSRCIVERPQRGCVQGTWAHLESADVVSVVPL
jgi:hypothetical protein